MLEARSIYFSYEDAHHSRLNFENISLHVKRNEIVSLLGESGCGKSTLLRILAGLLPLSNGTVTCFDRPVMQPLAPVGLVFQDYKNAVFPWLTARKNIEIGTSKRTRTDGKDMGVSQAAALLGINDLLDKYPAELSGGQIQRVQLGRALVGGVDYLILDEPDTSLDMEFKRQLSNIITDLVKQREIGVLLVTHSIDRAVYLSKRIYIMRRTDDMKSIEMIEREGLDQRGEFSDVMASTTFKEIYQCIYRTAVR